ncbi:glycoside hydrolase family 3 C-terminal domain-containing protein [Latilactobacillus curvatus]|nr:glycoside hydrolase family 3 C-terminal domain-containing protein [Latilactobacillus curvatus]
MLLKQLKALGKPIACVMVQGRPYDLTLVNELADAVLIAWFPGQQGGRVIAETLVGLNNPSGKLSVSYPRNTQQLPVYYYQRDAAKQDDYYDEVGQPLYPFGYGLSYDQFDYRQLAVKQMVDKLVVTVKVKNNGQFVGQESSLLFVKLTGGAVIQRMKLLKAFQKNAFQPGEEKSITFELPAADFNYMDIDNQVKRAQAATIMVADLAEKITLSI